MVKSPPAPSTLCIQFLDRESNDQKIHYHWENRFVLQKYGAVRKFYRSYVYNGQATKRQTEHVRKFS